ncbi:MAG: hypothetical protein MUD12_07575 [Spirochaetes bacterium]|jgi:hypothetical protein|nr:hypothetical protein [Spirochaetota bacterium]
MKKNIIAFLAAGAWIGTSEFARNEILFKSYWTDKYASLGMVFPSGTVNNAMWGAWSFMLAGLVVFLVRKLGLLESIAAAWLAAFVMMWVVAWNLNVLPLGLLLFAVPLSILEVALAALISRKIIAA